MKGTIDIQIKRKDGSIENRREHNIVFDIPALILKEFTEQPLRLLFGGMPSLRIPAMINWFNMSSELEDLTTPRRRPVVLLTTGSTSSVWHTAPITRIVENKKITMSASWTIGEPLTIRSINVPGTTYSSSGSTDLWVDKYGVLCYLNGGSMLQRVLSPSDYSFTNTSFSGLYPGYQAGSDYYSYLTSNTGEPMYFEHYPLANPAERFIYYIPSTGMSSSSPSTSSSGQFGYNNSGSDIGIRIVDHATRATLREFPISQFENALGTGQYTVFVVVRSETKNWLLRSYYYTENSATIYKTRIWQIPDTATAETIPCFSEDFASDIFTSRPITSRVDTIVANYIRIAHSDSSYANESWYKITDEGTLVPLLGCAKNVARSNMYLSRSYLTETLRVGSWSSNMSNPSTYAGDFLGAVEFPRITAANFLTPIELAEGDVLTVSYKIEVA